MIPNRVCKQPIDEWLDEYDKFSEYATHRVRAVIERPINVPELVFDHHRTARTKSGNRERLAKAGNSFHLREENSGSSG